MARKISAMRNTKKKVVMRKMQKKTTHAMCKILLTAAEFLIALTEELLATITREAADEVYSLMDGLALAVEKGPCSEESSSVTYQDSASTDGTDENDIGSELPMVEEAEFGEIQHFYPTLRHKKRAKSVNRLRAQYKQPLTQGAAKDLV